MCRNGMCVIVIEVLLILLYRLVYLNCWFEFIFLFGRVKLELSIIFNMVGG